MEKFATAAELLRKHQPERPVLGLRPHAAGRAAQWFLEHFDGEVAYAYKANSSVFLLGALFGAGIRHFDVASLPELEDAATIPGVEMHFMHPVKSRSAIRRAYDLGVRSFSLDSEDELKKIVEETHQSSGPARDLRLFVRVAVPAINSLIPLENKFGLDGVAAAKLLVKTRQVAAELGITFHVGSQTTTPDAFVTALDSVRVLIGQAGVVVDRLDVGGGFPAKYANSTPDPLIDFIKAIDDGVEELPVREDVRLMCEPGRVLVSEAESVIVRVDARRGHSLYINDGGYGTLFDAAHLGFVFPAHRVEIDGDTSPPRRMEGFELWGPTCDSIDHMPGPFMLPADIDEGDYIEIGNIGAYGRALAGKFNGYGTYDEVILQDLPFASMFDQDADSKPQVVQGV
ncbi:MAG: type III PLP-dependent enzyme [Pseudomonadota bacterium]